MKQYIKTANWLLLSLVMLTNLVFPLPALFAWILIVGEIGSGLAILARWKMKQIVIIPVIIVLVATFTAQLGDWINMALHLLVVTNYLLLLEE